MIRTNKIKCRKCGDIIKSIDVHDFKWCSCCIVVVDGGREYLRRVGNKEDILFINTYCHISSSNYISF